MPPSILAANPACAGRLSVQERMRRLSMKLFNVGPEVLPPETRGDLEGLLGVCPGFVETHLRPGCIHVALSGLVQVGFHRASAYKP